MTTLIHLLAALLAVASALFFFRVRSPRGAVLTLPKMLVSSGAAFVAGGGALVALLAVVAGAPVATVLGLAAAALSLRYLLRVGRAHDGFERAFGRDWQSRIRPERRTAMLKRRWVGRLGSTGEEPRCERDLVFWRFPESDRELLCDLWQPPPGTPSSRVALVYFHGSGWHWLDKDFNTRPLFRHLCAQGHVVMDVAYRLCPEVDVFGMVGDVKRATAWLKRNAERYDVDAQRVVLAGGSAGGHLSLLAAYAPDHPALTPDDVEGVDLSVRAVASYYGPVDLAAYDRHAGATLGPGAEAEAGAEADPDGKQAEPTKAPAPGGVGARITEAVMKWALGSMYDVIKQQDFGISHRQMMVNLLGGASDEVPDRYALTSPITHAGPGSPPTLLLQGEHDSLVPASACRALQRRLADAGVPVVHVEYPQTEHAFDVAVLPRYSPAAQAALYELERFLAVVAASPNGR